MARTQEHRFIAVTKPLGEDVLLLNSFLYSEALSSLFELELDLICEKPEFEIQFSQIVWQNVTIRLNPSGDKTRYFNGHVYDQIVENECNNIFFGDYTIGNLQSINTNVSCAL